MGILEDWSEEVELSKEKVEKDSLVLYKRPKRKFFYKVYKLKNPRPKKINRMTSRHTIRANYVSFKMDNLTINVGKLVGEFILSNSYNRDTVEELRLLCLSSDPEEEIERFLEEMYCFTDKYIDNFNKQNDIENLNKNTNLSSLEVDTELIRRDEEKKKQNLAEFSKLLGFE